MAQSILLRLALSAAIVLSLYAFSESAVAAVAVDTVDVKNAPDADPLVESYAPTHAVILVGGIYETSHYFDNWVPALSLPGAIVLGWDHNHRAMSMKASALLLAARIADLGAEGIVDVTIVAHSMGGLVAKGALDELSRSGKAKNFTRLEILAFGTPWGGYSFADLAAVLPGSETISKIIGYPMGPDIGPHSQYMKSLAQAMPANGELRIYVGTKDDIALPTGASAKSRYQSIEMRAARTTTMEGFDHVAYNMASPECLN
jgi:hypothetical protein